MYFRGIIYYFCFHCVQASALENVVKASQIEIIELQHTVDELRYLTSESYTDMFAMCPIWILLYLDIITHWRICTILIYSFADLVFFIDFAYCLTALRAELSLLKQHIEAQAKELSHRMRRIEELEDKERVANESVRLRLFKRLLSIGSLTVVVLVCVCLFLSVVYSVE